MAAEPAAGAVLAQIAEPARFPADGTRTMLAGTWASGRSGPMTHCGWPGLQTRPEEEGPDPGFGWCSRRQLARSRLSWVRQPLVTVDGNGAIVPSATRPSIRTRRTLAVWDGRLVMIEERDARLKSAHRDGVHSSSGIAVRIRGGEPSSGQFAARRRHSAATGLCGLAG